MPPAAAPAAFDRAAGRHPVPPSPRLQDALALGVHQVLPTQSARRRGPLGSRRLFIALLAGALEDAGLGPRRAPPPRTSPAYTRLADRLTRARRATATAWLLGALDAEVEVPVVLACDALGIDPAALAAAVRRALPRT